MYIHPIATRQDNYIWAIVKDDKAIIIDPADSEPVMAFLVQKKLTLSTILITHEHNDHIGGVAGLCERYPETSVFAHKRHHLRQSKSVDEGDVIVVEGLTFKVWQTSGHTATHLSYLLENDCQIHVFCGDTLFSGGCGRVFTGTADALFDSLMRFQTLPPDTLFYPAHEYTLSNLKFGQYIEPNNDEIRQAIHHTQRRLDQHEPSLPTRLSDECRINVFLRCQDGQIINTLTELNAIGVDKSPLAVFKALRELKNNF